MKNLMITQNIRKRRIFELDKLFTRLYDDNVCSKISDERFKQMSKGYETEQTKLKTQLSEFIKKAKLRKLILLNSSTSSANTLIYPS